MEFKTKIQELSERNIGFYFISNFPGNNELAVTHNVYIDPLYRGKGAGQKQHLERLAKIQEMGYVAAVCTVNAGNVVEKHILVKNGWKLVWTFISKDGEPVDVFARQQL